jgi:hypothetical protein
MALDASEESGGELAIDSGQRDTQLLTGFGASLMIDTSPHAFFRCEGVIPRKALDRHQRHGYEQK